MTSLKLVKGLALHTTTVIGTIVIDQKMKGQRLDHQNLVSVNKFLNFPLRWLV